MKKLDPNKISNQAGEIAYAAKELRVDPDFIKIAKRAVGNDRKKVYEWIKQKIKSDAFIQISVRDLLVDPDQHEIDEDVLRVSFAYDKQLEPVKALNTIIYSMVNDDDLQTNDISDGYHTFGEVYNHRITLFIALCKQFVDVESIPVWRSKNHSDGKPAFGGGWFVLGLHTAKGKQITYHLPIERWEETDFAETHDKAPTFDGHTAEDVLYRIQNLLNVQ